jgi:uncharacterized protein involved in exopolysaccharide biosynthesis
MTAELTTGQVQGPNHRIRIHELAQRLGIPPADLLRRAQAVDLEVTTVLQSIGEDDVRLILEDYRRPVPHGNGAAPEPDVVRSLLTELDAESAVVKGEPSRSLRLSDQGRRIGLTALGIILGTTVLVTALAVLRPVNAAESEVVITGLGSGGEARELESFNVVASSQTVLAPVSEAMGIPISDLRDAFSSEIVGDSTVLRFVVTDSDPEHARAVNDAIVESYLVVANQTIDQGQVDFIETRVADTGERLDEVTDRLQTLDSAAAVDEATRLRVESDLALAQSRLDTLESRLVDLRSSGEPPAGSISFVETQINETRAALDALLTEMQTLESPEKIAARAEAEQLRTERETLRNELAQLEQLEVELGLDRIAQARARVLAPAHVVDGPVGLTPVRAIALGLLVGGALAFGWIVGATQLRRRR